MLLAANHLLRGPLTLALLSAMALVVCRGNAHPADKHAVNLREADNGHS
jgi:hypothetical protein